MMGCRQSRLRFGNKAPLLIGLSILSILSFLKSPKICFSFMTIKLYNLTSH